MPWMHIQQNDLQTAREDIAHVMGFLEGLAERLKSDEFDHITGEMWATGIEAKAQVLSNALAELDKAQRPQA